MDLTLYNKYKISMLAAENNDCQQFFEENNLILEMGYWYLLHKNPQKAKLTFLKIQDSDIRAHWGAFISSIASEHIEGYPSYFELRNFYEVDLQLLFSYYLGNYIEEICKYTDWFFTINPEIYKYTGRAFINNDYADIGIYFLKKAKDKFYNDPELHYLLAENHIQTNQYNEAKEDLINCLNILPYYHPAEKMLQEISQYCK